MKYIFSFILLVGVLISNGEQVPNAKDDPQSRAGFEVLKYKDLETGDIPRGIRSKELSFMKSQKSLQRSNGVATNWSNRGPFNVGGRTRALAVDITDENIILAGGVSGGMWRSTDFGVTWTKTSAPDGLQSTSCIVQDKRDGFTNVWYYGTGEIQGNSAGDPGAPYRGDGLFKSTNGGVSWTKLDATATDLPQSNDQDFDYNYSLAVNPTNGNLIVANQGGIYQSEDGGDSFTKVLDDAGSQWSDVLVADDGTLYAMIAANGLWKSVDDGGTWEQISSSLAGFDTGNNNRKVIAMAPSNQNIIYVLGESASGVNGHMLWKFDESTDTWTDRTENVPVLSLLDDEGNVIVESATGDFNSQGGYDLMMAVSPTDENFLVIGGVNLYKSADAFETSINSPFSNNPNWIGGYNKANQNFGLYPNHHPDQHAFVFLDGDRALSASDGGVNYTENLNEAFVSWTSLNNGYLTTQPYAISVGPGDQIMAGFQDNSTWLTISTDSDYTWTDQLSGDGGYSAFSNNGRVRYMSSQLGTIWRANYSDQNDEGGSNYSQVMRDTEGDAEIYDASLFIVPFYLDPVDDQILYLGGGAQLFINTQAASSTPTTGWKILTLGGGINSEFGVTRNNMVIVGTSTGRIFRVTDPRGDTQFENITGSNMPSGAYVSGVSVNQSNSDEILVCFSNYSVRSVFYTSDGGQNWIDVSANLEENLDGSGSGPSTRTVGILGNGEKFFVGTSAGLYSTDNLDGESTVWVQEDPNGIGDVPVDHMVVREDGLVAIGTHGNGVFSANFTLGIPQDLQLATTSVQENLPVGTTVGVLTTTDNDDDVHTYSFDNSETTDNASFTIDQDELKTAEVFDFETRTSYTVKIITADDDGNQFSKLIALEILDDTADNTPLSTLDDDELGIRFYPNPTNNRIYVSMNNDYRGLIKVRVLDFAGKALVNNDTFSKTGENLNRFLELNQLSDGLYFLEITIGDKVYTGRIVKE